MLTSPGKSPQRSRTQSGSLALPRSTVHSVQGHPWASMTYGDRTQAGTAPHIVTFPTARPPTTARITPDTLITNVWNTHENTASKPRAERPAPEQQGHGHRMGATAKATQACHCPQHCPQWRAFPSSSPPRGKHWGSCAPTGMHPLLARALPRQGGVCPTSLALLQTLRGDPCTDVQPPTPT